MAEQAIEGHLPGLKEISIVSRYSFLLRLCSLLLIQGKRVMPVSGLGPCTFLLGREADERPMWYPIVSRHQPVQHES